MNRDTFYTILYYLLILILLSTPLLALLVDWWINYHTLESFFFLIITLIIMYGIIGLWWIIFYLPRYFDPYHCHMSDWTRIKGDKDE